VMPPASLGLSGRTRQIQRRRMYWASVSGEENSTTASSTEQVASTGLDMQVLIPVLHPCSQGRPGGREPGAAPCNGITTRGVPGMHVRMENNRV
jgi:hypothetical protein